jgi:hypothetical protein
VELEDYTRLTLRANTAFGEDSRLWTLYEAVAITMPSTIGEFTIPSYLEGVGNIPYVIAHNISLSHFKHLIFDAGIEAVDFSVTSSPIGYIQEITLPATLHTLIGYPFEWSNARQESYFFEENHHLDFTSPLITNNTFPSEKFPELQKIHVDENNPLFDSEDGILYQNNHLICIPQDYQSENGIVTIPCEEGQTVAIDFTQEGKGSETSIENSELKAQNSELIYDLMGRRVEKMEKGIYIINGRKVIK